MLFRAREMRRELLWLDSLDDRVSSSLITDDEYIARYDEVNRIHEAVVDHAMPMINQSLDDVWNLLQEPAAGCGGDSNAAGGGLGSGSDAGHQAAQQAFDALDERFEMIYSYIFLGPY